MRNYNDKYKYIVCDIDDTLIYGFWTDLMRITWDVFRSNKLSDFLMYLQNKFNLFKVNKFLKYILDNFNGKIVILTARKTYPATTNLIGKIIDPDQPIDIISLATDNPEIDKINYIVDNLKDGGVCVFDDNKRVLAECNFMDIDAFDARYFLDERIG